MKIDALQFVFQRSFSPRLWSHMSWWVSQFTFVLSVMRICHEMAPDHLAGHEVHLTTSIDCNKITDEKFSGWNQWDGWNSMRSETRARSSRVSWIGVLRSNCWGEREETVKSHVTMFTYKSWLGEIRSNHMSGKCPHVYIISFIEILSLLKQCLIVIDPLIIDIKHSFDRSNDESS
jgi:hypothetical protein